MSGPQSRLGRFDLPTQAPTFPWGCAVSLGRINGVTTFQRAATIDGVGASFETLWAEGGVYPNVTTTETLDIVSDSTNDDAGGTGALLLSVDGLNSAGVEISETVAMDGTTPVTTTASFSYLHRLVVLTAGSALTNVGKITATNSTSAQTLGTVLADLGITQQLPYKVPAGKYLILETFTLGSSAGDAMIIDSQRRLQGGAWLTVSRIELPEMSVHFKVFPNISVPPLTEITMRTRRVSGGGSAQASAIILGYLFEEKYFNAT